VPDVRVKAALKADEEATDEPVFLSEPPLPLRQTERVVQIKSRPAAGSSNSGGDGKKSRFFLSKTANANLKRAAYRHKWVADGEVDEEAKTAAAKAGAGADAKSNAYDDFDGDFGATPATGEAPKLRRVVTASNQDGPDVDEDGKGIVSYKCSREEKKVRHF
jgi:hypothetical protein